eukprot:GEMP01050303.1.p1 GENE.GEMP01050303.1~~GEMP01050303.1.p1  ORF type:complete len:236 (+),score=63.89 GEMP01050303.1:79-786(+)
MVENGFREVQRRIAHAALAAGRQQDSVRLVAVGKFHPVSALKQVYDLGHRHFGENYVQELVEKVREMPDDVCWHFIGHLQSNKVNALVKAVPNLIIETVDSVKLANVIAKAAEGRDTPLPVLVQINTSGEGSKSGANPDEIVTLCRAVYAHSALRLLGLMTIGAPDFSGCRTEDFECLHRCKSQVEESLQGLQDPLELSMGMSTDFETAISHNSTSVRIGSHIFGPRPTKEAASS